MTKYISPAGNRWIMVDKLEEIVYGMNKPYLIKQYEQGKDVPQEIRLSKEEWDGMSETLIDNGWIRG